MAGLYPSRNHVEQYMQEISIHISIMKWLLFCIRKKQSNKHNKIILESMSTEKHKHDNNYEYMMTYECDEAPSFSKDYLHILHEFN